MSTAAALLRTGWAEWSRLWSVRSTWVLVVLLALGIAGLGALAGHDAGNSVGVADTRTAWDGARFTTLFVLFGVLALSVVATGSDYGTGGVVPTLQWTPRRGVLLAGRTVVVTGTSVLLGLLLVTTAAGLVVLQAPDLGLPVGAGLSTLGDVALVVGCGSLLGTGLAFLTRSTAGALVTGIALLVVLPLVLGNLPYETLRTVAEYLPGSGAIDVVFGRPPVEGMTDLSARVTLLAWGVGVLVLGGLRLTRTDAGR